MAFQHAAVKNGCSSGRFQHAAVTAIIYVVDLYEQKMYLIAGLKVVACRNSVDIVQICLMYTQGCDCGYSTSREGVF